MIIRSFVKNILIVSLIFYWTVNPGQAQEEPKVNLIADEIILHQDGHYMAEGNVKISTENILLQATKIEFDADTYKFHGPLYISDTFGTKAVADFASLSNQDQRGIIEGLRILYRNRLQITSGTAKSSNGSLVFFNNLITTCEVCTPGEKPLWYFQAESITMNEDSGRIHLKNVSFKIWDVPILHLPWFSLGQPASGRQSGFLIPEVKYSSSAGIEAKIPYYYVLNDQTDITLSFGRTPQKEAGFNFEFRNNSKAGWIFFEGAYPFRNEKDLGLFEKDLVFKGVQKPDATSQISFLVTDTSSENTSYPAGLFPDGNKLIFLEATKSLPLGELKFRTIDINPLHAADKINNKARLVSMGLETRDLLPNAKPRLTFDLEFNSTLQDANSGNPKLYDFKNASLQGKYSDSRIFGGGFKSSTTVFLHGEIYDQDTTEDKKGVDYGRAMIVNNLSFPLVLYGGSGHQTITPFIQMVYSQDNGAELPERPEAKQVIDRSKFLSNQQDIAESFVRDGREVSLGLKYHTAFRDSQLDLILGKTMLDAEKDPEYVHAGNLKTHYFVESILELGENIEVSSLFVGDNDLRVVSNYSLLSIANDEFQTDISYGWIRDGENDNVKSESASAKISMPISDKWTGYTNVEYDFRGESKRELEIGAIYYHQCLTMEISAERTYKTSTTALSKPDYSIGISLIGFTSASTLSTKKCN